MRAAHEFDIATASNQAHVARRDDNQQRAEAVSHATILVDYADRRRRYRNIASAQPIAASASVAGSGTATAFERNTPLDPSVKLAQKAIWPSLLKPLGFPLEL